MVRKVSPQNQDLVHYLYLAAILAYALFYCYYQVTNLIPGRYRTSGDDATYPFLAQQFLNGTFKESTFIFSVRIMQILPTALFTALLGPSTYADSAWNIASFLGTIIVAFYAGREMFDRNAGTISAMLMAFFPLPAVLSYTSHVEGPVIFISSLCVLALVYAKKRNSPRWAFASGLLMVAIPLVSPTGFVMDFVLVLYLVLERFIAKQRIPARIELNIVYGVIVASVMTAAFNYAYSGNPLITMTTTSNFLSTVGCSPNQTAAGVNLTLYERFGVEVGCGNNIPWLISSPYVYLSIMFPYNLSLNSIGNILNQYNRVGLFFYLAFPALLYLIWKRQRSAAFAVFWFVVGLVYLEFGPMHVSVFPLQYLPMQKDVWYLAAILSMPTTLMISIALARFSSDGGNARRLAVILIVALLIFTSLNIDANMFIGFG